MRRLVAIDLPAGPAFVDAALRCFDAGDAICPIDQRLSTTARQRIFATLSPSAMIDSSGAFTDLEGGEPIEEGDLVVVATSGTTGAPKGVVLTREAVMASARATSTRLGANSTDHWLCCLPLAHVGGLSIVLRSLFTDTALTVIDGFDPARIDEILDRGATLTSLVPTTLARLGHATALRFRSILLGGSALPEKLADNVVRTYGMTETGSGVVYDGIALEGVEIRIDGTGEISLRCPMLLRTYRDGSDPRDEHGFYPTGDVGRINDSGRLEVFGRSSECIISGGENIWPIALERLIGEMQSVREIGVVGVSDPEWGQRTVGIVVPVPGATPTIAEMNDRIKDQIGPWAVLKELITVSVLPRTATDKLDRAALATLTHSNSIHRVD